ncbi:hypothetical protein DNTS_034529 [Danionella cerebrum]|uniref:Uncharacterized protein n=1 Tax=Danionella cerebrum TaxID=2873325 RepID=A0A553MPK3_9TELE|nr:hypothetical protein DNTS_034529 [Danionella translucida]
MADDPDSIPEREMKNSYINSSIIVVRSVYMFFNLLFCVVQDFQFRQMKKIRVFESCLDLPKERSSLLTISNKYNLTFAARDRTLKIFWSKDLICAGLQEGNPNDTVECVSAMTADLDVSMHHVSLSCDELTLCVCGLGENANLMLHFYDVRSFFSKQFAPAHPFCSYRPEVSPQSLVQDVKWSPVEASRLALCVSDGSMVVLDVQESVSVVKSLPASAGVTCRQYPTLIDPLYILEAKKVIPCPSFYSQDHPVKATLGTLDFSLLYDQENNALHCTINKAKNVG